MEFDLCSGIMIRSGTFNALIAPDELAAIVLAGHQKLQRFPLLCVGGTSSQLLSAIRPSSPNVDARTARTAADLKNILETARHTIIFVEHDPAWYDHHEELLPVISHELGKQAENALVILYAREPDRTFMVLCRKAHRVFFFDFPRVPARHTPRRDYRVPGAGKSAIRIPRQHTLEGI